MSTVKDEIENAPEVEFEPVDLSEADADPLADLAQRAVDDSGAPFEPTALKAISRLRNGDPAEWQRLRTKLKDAKVRMSDLDRALDRLDGGAGTDERTGRPLKPRDVEPWHSMVDGAAMLDELAHRLREYIIMSTTAADATALWAVHTHALDACHYTPRLFITSPDKRCGKSQLLKVVGKAVARPLLAGNISSASIYRTVQAVHPTLLVDELDAHKKDDEEMRGVINNGYERGNPNIRCDPNTLEPLEFDTFAACAVASIGRIWSTVEDRSIIIRLHRKRPSGRVRKFRRNHAPELDRLASMAARWALDHIEPIKTADPDTPEALSDRAADIWEPLLAIADLAGGDWPARARHAALALSGDGVIEDQSIGTMLLADLRGFIKERTGEAFATKNIIEHLATIEERPWPAYGRGRTTINPRQLADILRPFEVYSSSIRIGTATPKGYQRKDIERAAGQYLTDSPATPPQPAENLEKSLFSPATNEVDVADENLLKPNVSGRCGGVADRIGETPADGHDEVAEWTA